MPTPSAHPDPSAGAAAEAAAARAPGPPPADITDDLADRDHRHLGRQLDLFATDELVGAGLPLWLPDGTVVRGALERFVVELEDRTGHRRVATPVLGKRELYETSGHWQHFRDDMFPPLDLGDEQLVLRPANCPHHMLVYRSAQRSFRDLPVRLAELGTMFRYERSGVVGGLARVRAMTLNDGHVFATVDQVEDEVGRILALIDEAYAVLGIDDHWLRLSLRGPLRSYADGPWDRAEDALRSVLAARGRSWVEAADEAAFYGPKIDVQVRDVRGREETLSTVQVDFHHPRAFGLEYTDADGQRRQPVMIHRSLVSTMERLTAFLIERYAGAFPVWLAPVQLVALPVAEGHVDAADALRAHARDAGLRVEVADPRASLGARIRAARERWVPFMAVIGDREVTDGTVSIRRRDDVRLAPQSVDAALHGIAALARLRSRTLDLPD
jgi:threonyl-tRNA synthetase